LRAPRPIRFAADDLPTPAIMPGGFISPAA
jgi:hypothetical protein